MIQKMFSIEAMLMTSCALLIINFILCVVMGWLLITVRRLLRELEKFQK